MSECVFNEELHQYTRDGVVLHSVTKIIQECLPRTDSAPEEAIYQAGLRGTFVDLAVAEYLRTGEVTVPAGTDRSWVDCVSQAVEWFEKERKGAKIETQLRLFGEHEAGSLDFLVDDFEILDLKATYEINKKTMPIQTGAYGDLLEETRGLPHPAGIKIGVLHVNKRFKKAQFRPFDYEQGYQNWRILKSYWRLRYS